MTKSDDRRAAIIEKIADYILAEGLSASSLRPLAEAAGTSDRMLLYYFKDKTDLIAASLGQIAARLANHLQTELSGKRLPYEQLRKKVVRLVLAPGVRPYMRVWLEIAASSGRGDPFFRAVGEQIARGFLAFTEQQLDAPPAKRRMEALRLLVAVEGTLFLKSVGLDEVAKL